MKRGIVRSVYWIAFCGEKKEAKIKVFRVIVGLLVIVSLLGLGKVGGVEAQEPVDAIPGLVEGTGTHFEVTNSDYLNVTLDSTETIALYLHSVPEMLLIDITAASDATSTQITIGGLATNTTYYQHQDGVPGYVEVMTDGGGNLVFLQDLITAHLIRIQAQPSTIYIRDDKTGGDCTTIGDWDDSAKVCTLNQDVLETIQILSPGVTLDGNGFSISGHKKGDGVLVEKAKSVTLKNLNIRDFENGIRSYYSSSVTIANCSTTGNTYGIYSKGGETTITNSNVVRNTYGIYSLGGQTTIAYNTIIENRSAGIYSSSASVSIFSNLFTGNITGIYTEYSNAWIANNTIVNNVQGIRMRYVKSQDEVNITSNIIAQNMYAGVYREGSFVLTIEYNDVWDNRPNYDGCYAGQGDISQDPLFADPGAGNYRLKAASLCIDSGSPWLSYPKPWHIDLDGNPRESDGNGDGVDRLDMGAYERKPMPPNHLPTADAGGPYFAAEGDTITLDASRSNDVDGKIVSYQWDLDNDGKFDAFGVTTLLPLVDNGSLTITLLVIDDHDGQDEDRTTVTIDNVAPVVGAITAPMDPVQVGTEINVSADFMDPGQLDTHTAEWYWADGSTSPGIVVEANGSGTVTANHTYTEPGVYKIGLTVKDKDGGLGGAVFGFVVVYDPEGGFVTGGGWIDSPEGAYQPDLSLAGKASFGFVSKYKKGATTPSGNTEFQFKAGNLNFHSASYEWLVVTGGNTARFKGVGTINGTGEYKFTIWASDGSPDTFRIRIWTEDELGVETDVYDNGTDQPIANGSIVVHSK